ncbi:MAG: metal-binding protein [Gammaproteobacteria bacterium]|nr:metal-binding protein [Gammaproteobacteria bacterium]
MFARHFIDSWDFAHKGKELRGEIPVAEMPRLADMLISTDGQVSYVLRGYQDKDGNPMLELSLDGLCQLRCQRCLQRMDYPVRLVSRLMLADTQPENELSEDEYDSVPADPHQDVSALVEEEILLSLPFAPKHEPGACQAATEGLLQSDGNPFTVLRSLKNK